MIRYVLRENLLTEEPNDYYAQVSPIATLSQEQLIDRASQRGTGVTKIDLKAAFNLIQEEIMMALDEGYHIKTDTATYTVGIQGVFMGSDAKFDASKHSIKAKARAGKVLLQKVKQSSVEKIAETVDRSSAVLQNFKDVGSLTNNTQISPSKSAEIRGLRLKIDTTDDLQGIFFVATDDTAYKVAAPTLLVNSPSKLIFTIPDNLPTGIYSLEVRNKIGGSKDIRVGALDEDLEVL